MKKLNTYRIDGIELDSIDLKCMVVTKGVALDPAVVEAYQDTCRISKDPAQFSNLYFSDGISAAMIDTVERFNQQSMRDSWKDEDRKIFEPQLATPFTVEMRDDQAVLCYKGEFVDTVSFPRANDYYSQKTPDGTPYLYLSTLQGDEWNSFAYLWPCDYAANGFPCQFCHSGLHSASLKANGEAPEQAVPANFVADMVDYSVKHAGVKSLQITGGSTFSGKGEAEHLLPILDAIMTKTGEENITGDTLLFVTPPKDLSCIDEYFSRGVDRIACSVEVWDEGLARTITPGKMKFTTRQRHFDAWDYIVKNYGLNRAFTNFVLGVEPFDRVAEGVHFAAERGVYPGGCIWVCGGCSCNGIVTAPGLDFYRQCKELFYQIYSDYGFIPDRSPMPSDLQAEIYNYLIAD